MIIRSYSPPKCRPILRTKREEAGPRSNLASSLRPMPTAISHKIKYGPNTDMVQKQSANGVSGCGVDSFPEGPSRISRKNRNLFCSLTTTSPN